MLWPESRFLGPEMREFAFIDGCLMVCGSCVQKNTRIVRILNNIFLTVLMFAYVTTLVTHILFIDMSDEPLFYAAYFADMFSGSIFILTMNRNRSQFQAILTQASKFLSKNQKKSLQAHAIISFLIQVFIFCICVSVATIHLTESRPAWDHITIDAFRYYASFNGWYITGILSYSFLVKVIRFRDANYYNHLESKLKRLQIQDVRHVIRSLRKETEFKTSVLSVFSGIPVLWFSIIYLKVAMVYENSVSINSDSNTPQVVLRLTETTIVISLIVYLINLCEETACAAKDRISRITMSIVGNSHLDLQLAHQMERMQFSFKIWSMFDISRAFGLSFLASLITFTVLFIQITNNTGIKG